MLNNNPFREAKLLRESKRFDELIEEERERVLFLEIPLDRDSRYNDMTTLEGLEELARLFEERGVAE